MNILFKTDWFTIESVPMPDGQPFFCLKCKDAVIVLAITTDDKIVMVKQYRPTLNRYALELPAGSIEEGESPLAAAKRELYEETGFICNRYTLLYKGLTWQSRTNMTFSLYLGLDTQFDHNYKASEDIQVVLIDVTDAKRLFYEGIVDNFIYYTALKLAEEKCGIRF
jgi:ADP-ribose pyrophosphatase